MLKIYKIMTLWNLSWRKKSQMINLQILKTNKQISIQHQTTNTFTLNLKSKEFNNFLVTFLSCRINKNLVSNPLMKITKNKKLSNMKEEFKVLFLLSEWKLIKSFAHSPSIPKLKKEGLIPKLHLPMENLIVMESKS